MSEQNERITDLIEQERARLRGFIEHRVPSALDAEDILQDVFSRLVEANRLLMPIDHITGWLFQVARNRIIDLYRKPTPDSFSDSDVVDEDEDLSLEDLLPSPEAGPEAQHARRILVDQLILAIEDLPQEQREAFVGQVLEGRSFKDMAAGTGVSINTLLARKRYAVLRLRERLQTIYDEYLEG